MNPIHHPTRYERGLLGASLFPRGPVWNGHEQHPCAHPERPWWRLHEKLSYDRNDQRYGLAQRSDGLRIDYCGPERFVVDTPEGAVYPPGTLRLVRCGDSDVDDILDDVEVKTKVRANPWSLGRSCLEAPCFREQLEELLVTADRRFPLPHPGFKVGQVWQVPTDVRFVDLLCHGPKRDILIISSIEISRDCCAPEAILVAGPGAPWAPSETT